MRKELGVIIGIVLLPLMLVASGLMLIKSFFIAKKYRKKK